MTHPHLRGTGGFWYHSACGGILSLLYWLRKIQLWGLPRLMLLIASNKTFFLTNFQFHASTALKKYAAKKNRGYKSLKLWVHDCHLCRTDSSDISTYSIQSKTWRIFWIQKWGKLDGRFAAQTMSSSCWAQLQMPSARAIYRLFLRLWDLYIFLVIIFCRSYLYLHFLNLAHIGRNDRKGEFLEGNLFASTG